MANEVYFGADKSKAETVRDFGYDWEAIELSGHAFTFNTSMVELDTEGEAASDYLFTIANGGTGKSVFIHIKDDGRPITLGHDIGNIWCPSEEAVVLSNFHQIAWLMYNGQFWVLMNISAPGGAGGWCYEFDFTVDDGGWTVTGAGGTYVTSTGWRTEVDFGGHILSIGVVFDPDPIITRVEVDFELNSSEAMTIEVTAVQAGPDETESGNYTTSGTYEFVGTFTNLNEVTTLNVSTFNGVSGGSDYITVTAVRIYGKLENPFGSSNC